METPESQEPAPGRDRGRGLRSGLLAAGAAFGMTLAGLGIAGAQIDDATQGSTTTTAAAQSEPDTSAPAQPSPETTQAPAPAPSTQQAPDGMRRHGPGHKGANLAIAARAIGIPESELLTALRDGQSIAQVAQSRNVDVQKVIDALVADAKAHLAEHVAAGRITQEEADEKSANLTARITEMVNRTGLGGHHRGPGRHGPGHKADLGVAAQAIGISESELLEALRDGQSIAQVAQSRNVDVQKVIDALVADVKARLAERVQAGDLTQDQADEKSANLAARITEMVNRTGFGPGPGHHGLRPMPPADAPSSGTN